MVIEAAMVGETVCGAGPFAPNKHSIGLELPYVRRRANRKGDAAPFGIAPEGDSLCQLLWRVGPIMVAVCARGHNDE